MQNDVMVGGLTGMDSALGPSVIASLEERLASLQELYEGLKALHGDRKFKKYCELVVREQYEAGLESVLRLKGEDLYRKQGYVQALEDHFMKIDKKMKLAYAEIGILTNRIKELKEHQYGEHGIEA